MKDSALWMVIFISTLLSAAPVHALQDNAFADLDALNCEYGQKLDLPAGDIRRVEPKRAISGEKPGTAQEFRIAAEQEIPAFYSYGSDYGREYLANNKPSYVECYDDLFEQCVSFEGRYDNVFGSTVYYSSEIPVTVYYLPKLPDKECEYYLNISELEEVYVTLQNDHPEFYWLAGFDYSYSSVDGPYSVNLLIDGEYASGRVRADLDSQIQKNFETYFSAAKPYKSQSAYMTAKKLHDDIATDVEYCYMTVYTYPYEDENGETVYADVYEDENGDYVYKNNNGEYVYVDIEDESIIMSYAPSTETYAHNIVSVLDDDPYTMPVCEGYAKTYKLVLNALGIDNVYVTGWSKGNSDWEEHAWSIVKLDDGKYYWVDLTWDDQSYGVIYDFFARGNTAFIDHNENLPEYIGYDFLYVLPEVPDADFDVMAVVNKSLITGMSVTHSGTCGAKLNWKIYENGVLYISGEGDMSSFDFDYDKQECSAPWYQYQSEITYVVVDEGVTSISSFAFWRCTEAKYMYLPEGLKTIGDYALGNCIRLELMLLPASIEFAERTFFGHYPNLGNIYITAVRRSSGLLLHSHRQLFPRIQ